VERLPELVKGQLRSAGPGSTNGSLYVCDQLQQYGWGNKKENGDGDFGEVNRYSTKAC